MTFVAAVAHYYRPLIARSIFQSVDCKNAEDGTLVSHWNPRQSFNQGIP